MVELGKTDINEGDDTQQEQTERSIPAPNQINGVNEAALSIASCALKVAGGPPAGQPPTLTSQSRRRNFCIQCTGFLQARIVRNANGTDMSLQREALKARRKYMAERRLQMECLMSAATMKAQSLYSVGCTPHI